VLFEGSIGIDPRLGGGGSDVFFCGGWATTGAEVPLPYRACGEQVAREEMKGSNHWFGICVSKEEEASKGDDEGVGDDHDEVINVEIKISVISKSKVDGGARPARSSCLPLQALRRSGFVPSWPWASLLNYELEYQMSIL
jgi:hypothetical protein